MERTVGLSKLCVVVLVVASAFALCPAAASAASCVDLSAAAALPQVASGGSEVGGQSGTVVVGVPEPVLVLTCQECLAFCAADYQDCISSGLPIGVCLNQRTACRNDCKANECA